MDDSTLERYSRHLLLNEFGIQAQERLLAAHALVVGAGGLGSSALLYLATSGIGKITVADGDVVERSNLQRQIIHRESTIGVNKSLSAQQTMLAINPSITVNAITDRLGAAALNEVVKTADVVLDCSDNFVTRYAINAACLHHSKPLVSGAGVRFDGQLSVFDFRQYNTPCYHCIFPPDLESEEERCAVTGVFAPLVGIIGVMQAAEAIKLIAGIGESVAGKMMMFDALTTRWHSVNLKQDPACLMCGESSDRGRASEGRDEVSHV
jgi:molybdopterin-synthase adenylyltransferase